ncbi:hypothetical protein [Planotetraspora sp. GP83]|uniref:hypothetical protein n=1 Tax=Planotetraspora sp. GP83 TaxID=3156264 RepID=UPI0035144C85
MSRTDNTRPIRFQEQDGREFTRDVGGSSAGRGKVTGLWEHQARQRVRLTLARGDEPEPTRHRHGARHDRH